MSALKSGRKICRPKAVERGIYAASTSKGKAGMVLVASFHPDVEAG
jgi:hypothetical protein